MWSKVIIKTLAKVATEEKEPKILEGKNQLLKEIKIRTIGSPQEHLKIFSGLLRRKDVLELKKSTGLSENRCKNFISNFFDRLRNQFHKDIWKHRCKEVITMEKTLGITNKVKKSVHKEDLIYKSKKDTNSRRGKKKTSTKRNKTYKQSNSIISELGSKIKSWIQFGKKWMGI